MPKLSDEQIDQIKIYLESELEGVGIANVMPTEEGELCMRFEGCNKMQRHAIDGLFKAYPSCTVTHAMTLGGHSGNVIVFLRAEGVSKLLEDSNSSTMSMKM